MSTTARSVLEDLNPEQRKAAEQIEGPVLIFAGAGSGKTRALTYRIAYMVRECDIPPESILAVTFTNKAANGMKERIAALIGEQARQVWAGTFHSICARVLRIDGSAIGIPPNFVIFDASEQLAVVKEALSVLNIDPKQYSPVDVHARISRGKNELMTVADFGRTRKGSFEQAVSQAYRVYQEKLEQNDALDFDDLLMRAVELLDEVPEVRQKYQERLRYVLVDEYQDINFAQYKFVTTLAAEHKNICVVGDDDQSIYGWRGANVGIILAFESDYPECEVVRLEQNYRSTQKIIECAFEVIRRNKDRAEKRLWTENHPGDNVVVYEAVNESEEAEWVAQNIADQVERRLTRYGDYAVLYRTNAMSRNFEEALIAKGIPYRVVGGLRFYERAEIKDVVAYLRVLYNPADGVSLRRIINKPTRGIGDKTLAVLDQYAYENACSLYEALGKAEGMDDLSLRAQTAVSSFHGTMEELRQKADGLRLPELSNAVMEDSGYVQALREQGTAEAASRIENLQEFVTLAGKFREAYAEGEPDLGAFLQHISLLSDIDEAEDPGNAVSLLTLHSAKGLEFPVVFMVGLEENIFPHQRSMKDELELAEERRLCYVGITRAQRMLYMSHAFRRTIYGQPQDQRPSRFIGELPQDLITRRQDVSRLARPQIFEEEEAELEAAGGPKLDLTSILSRKKKTTDDRPSTKSKSPKKTRSTRSKAAAARAKGEGDGQAFKTGTKVTHPKFGDGIVVSTEGEADEAILTVAFLSTGVKKLAAAYAKLKRR